LAGTQKDVVSCKSVTDEVKREMFEIVVGLQQKLMKKTRLDTDDDVIEIEKRKRIEEEDRTIFKKRATSSQTTINQLFKKDQRESVCRDVARHFYDNGIPFNVSRSRSFKRMVESIANYGPGFKPPSYHEIRVKYLKEEVQATKDALEVHRCRNRGHDGDGEQKYIIFFNFQNRGVATIVY